MTTQPEALRLAAHAEANSNFGDMKLIAAELRRLHEVEKERDDLLAALKELDEKPGFPSSWLKARAAIAKAEGEAK